MEENLTVASPPNVMPESEVSTQIIEEGPRVCPLCGSEIRLFFINYHEKLLMCENTECEFPFGCEELQFVQVPNDDNFSDIVSVRTQSRPYSPSISVISTSAWSEIERLNRVCESEDSQLGTNIPSKKSKKVNKKIEKEKIIQKNVEDLKGLSLELSDITKTRKTIRNEKWIKNLMQLQDQSGMKLVEPQEMMKLVKHEEVKSELKIDIEPGISGCMSSIKIEITNQGQIEETTNQGQIEDITNQGQIEEITNQGQIEEITNQGQIEEITNQGQIEEITNQGQIEEITNQGQIEEITNQGQIEINSQSQDKLSVA